MFFINRWSRHLSCLLCFTKSVSISTIYGCYRFYQEKKEEKVNQVSQQEKKQSSKQKPESQSTQQKQTTTSNQETSTSHQTQVQDVPEKEEEVYIEEEIASVYVTITGVDGVMAQDYIEYEEGISAYDALKILADNYEMPVSTSGIGQATDLWNLIMVACQDGNIRLMEHILKRVQVLAL